jgi:uncharacterized protein YndB with AHSA1/START domain
MVYDKRRHLESSTRSKQKSLNTDMELKTKVVAEAGRQDLLITRAFDLPVELLFRAYTEADLVAQWMGTTVEKLESKKHGSYRFETTDPRGNIHGFTGTIHDIVHNQKIIRTFEMEHTPFGVQLEVYNFEPITDQSSKLTMHVIYESADQRDQVLKLPFSQGINMAHNRLENTLNSLK